MIQKDKRYSLLLCDVSWKEEEVYDIASAAEGNWGVHLELYLLQPKEAALKMKIK